MKSKYKKKYYKEKDLTGKGHTPGRLIKMSDREYIIGKDGEYRMHQIINKEK